MRKPVEIFAENLKRLRAARNLTQEALAEKAGMAVGTVRQFEYEKRFPRQAQIEALATALNTSIYEFFVEKTVFVQEPSMLVSLGVITEAIQEASFIPDDIRRALSAADESTLESVRLVLANEAKIAEKLGTSAKKVDKSQIKKRRA